MIAKMKVSSITLSVLAVAASILLVAADQNVNNEINQPDPRYGEQDASKYFFVAVYEHEYVNKSNTSWKATVQANLDVYKNVARYAAESQKAQVIVFPEDGILVGKRDFIDPGLPELPNPELLNEENNNPCLHEASYKGEPMEVLRNLSCIARENNLYVVANFGSRETCQPGSSVGPRVCPEKGYFAFNTDVVLSNEGKFIKRYRKFNLFLEVFDKPPTVEVAHFDTPFGRFGIFTCFDILFKTPAVELIEKHQIDTVLFPTWWYDELPSLTSIQFQDSWSNKHKVNLLAANIHEPFIGSVGSGIYSLDKTIYVGPNEKGPSLLTARVPIKPREIRSDSSIKINPKYMFSSMLTKFHTWGSNLQDDPSPYQHENFVLMRSDSVWVLNKKEDKRTICADQVCCSVDYKISPTSYYKLGDNKLILIVRDSLRLAPFRWYEQVCTVATLTASFNAKQLNMTKFSTESYVEFDQLNLKGTFNSEYVYPIAAYSDGRLIEHEDREYECNKISRDIESDQLISCKLDYAGERTKGIYSFGFYGRMYSRDEIPQ